MEKGIETEQNNDSAQSCVLTSASYIREVTVNYRGPRRERLTIREAKTAADFIRKILPDNSREHFAALYLDAAHQVIGFAIVSTGTANTTLVHPREVFQRAVLLGAVALIVAHNHPSGGERPSDEDSRVTKVLKAAGEVLGIRLLDHIIVTEETFWSFAEKGMF
jgi:DNA repair protein RadC